MKDAIKKMLNIFNTSSFGAILAEGAADWLEFVLPLVFFVVIGIINVIAKKANEAKERRQVEENQQRIDAHRAVLGSSSQSRPPSEGSWRQVRSTPGEIQEFLEQARKRTEERKRRKMLRKHGYHAQSGDVKQDAFDSGQLEQSHQPLPSEMPTPKPHLTVESVPVPIPVPTSQPAAPSKVHQQEKRYRIPEVSAYNEPEPVKQHDYNECEETHRIVTDNPSEKTPAARHILYGLDNVDSLKRAVIFSEILGRPKAFQENMGAWEFPC